MNIHVSECKYLFTYGPNYMNPAYFTLAAIDLKP